MPTNTVLDENSVPFPVWSIGPDNSPPLFEKIHPSVLHKIRIDLLLNKVSHA